MTKAILSQNLTPLIICSPYPSLEEADRQNNEEEINVMSEYTLLPDVPNSNNESKRN